MNTASHHLNRKKHSQDTTKKHNTAKTSIESFSLVNTTGQRMKEKEKVLAVIAQWQPVTSRSLSQITGIERSNICRSLFDLVHENKPQVKEWQTVKCPITNRRVKTYVLSKYPQQKLL